MPGIVIKALSEPSATLAEEFSEMMDRLRHQPWYTQEQWHDPSSRVAMGRLALGFVNNAPQPAHSPDGAQTAVLCGELYDAAELRRELQADRQPPLGQGQAEIFLRGYQQHGEQFLRRLNGVFVAAIWDAKRQRLTICNDRFGMKPFYYAHLPGKLLAAVEIKALLADADVRSSENLRGLAEFFTFGHLLGEETMIESVRMLLPASVLTYDLREDRVTRDAYWTLPVGDSSQMARDPVAALDEIDRAFVSAVNRCLGDNDHLGLALSGGLDGRSILAVVDQGRIRLKTVSMGVPGSLDHRCAAQLAALTNGEHYQYLLDGRVCDCDAYRRNLERVVHLSDGHYLDQAIVMPMLPYYRELGIEVLLRGHAGEIMHLDKAYNFSLDESAWRIHDEAGLEQWLMGHLSGWILGGVPEPLLRQASADEVHDLALSSLRGGLQESAGVRPTIHRIWHLFIRRRLPRETAMSLAMIGSMIETRIPILDARLVELLLSLPPEMKIGERIQAHILRRHRPEFLSVVNANNGARLGVGRARQRFSTLKMKVLAKMRVRGYQPYERLGLWLRRELRPLVADVLLTDRCLERGVLNPDAVRNVVQRHWENRANHTYLLMAMMIFEMGQRQFVDGDATASPLGSMAG